jgi:FlaA1/EpsC-like NDP-sugar epimerase
MAADVILLTLSLYLSFILRFEWRIPEEYIPYLPIYGAVFIAPKIVLFIYFRLYRMSWTHVGLYELFNVVKALTLGTLLVGSFLFSMKPYSLFLFAGFPRSVLIIDYALSLLFISGFRVSKRAYSSLINENITNAGKKTLIIGAGNAGEQIVRDMKRLNSSPYFPVAFVDDNPVKQGIYIHGVKVCGKREDIPKLVEKFDIELILIAIPSARSTDIKNIISFVRKAHVKDVKIIPSISAILKGTVSFSDIKEINIEDILGRKQVKIDISSIRNYLKGKRVLVTGAGGSIGSDITRQVASFKPSALIALDIDETELFNVDRKIKKEDNLIPLYPVVCDITDRFKVNRIIGKYLPDVIFHAAAYKHVPMMELYPEEAVKVNILGTRIVAETAIFHGVKKFVLVSTDKAVNPTSVMGATKYVAEKVVSRLNNEGVTEFTTVRFGNVVGSRGSVIEIFGEQIKNGGPVTVTDKGMKRYFMSISEAVSLILQAGAVGKGGEVFVLDMGQPVRIMDIAIEMIRLSGFEPDKDIPIIYKGIRPGEKLFEELYTPDEGCEKTAHPMIFKIRDKKDYRNDILKEVTKFEELLKTGDEKKILEMINGIILSYQATSHHLDYSCRSGNIVNFNEHRIPD